MGAAAVEAYVHECAAPRLVGTDPLAIEARATSLTGWLGRRDSGVETRGNSALDIALWDLFRQSAGMPLRTALGGASRESIRVYSTCAGYRWDTEPVTEMPRVANGELSLNDKPGLGIALLPDLHRRADATQRFTDVT